jgi:hypothetical protein
MENSPAFDWVSERAKCSLEGAFQCLAEVVDSDVKAVLSLRRAGVTFVCHRPAPTKLVVARTRDLGSLTEIDSVVFELTKTGIVATAKDSAGNGPELVRATPNFRKEGDCCLSVKGEDVPFWQVSRLALEDLFFGF